MAQLKRLLAREDAQDEVLLQIVLDCKLDASLNNEIANLMPASIIVNLASVSC